MTLCATSIEFEYNSTNELNFNWKKIGCILMKHVLKFFLWIWCWKKKNFWQDTKLEKTSFYTYLLGNGLKNSNLKLFKWWL
jgi:hypothetical protein